MNYTTEKSAYETIFFCNCTYFFLLQFFDTDKDDTSGNISYHVSSTVEYTQYVKINVTMHISGSTSICLRFEIYGCDTSKYIF